MLFNITEASMFHKIKIFPSYLILIAKTLGLLIVMQMVLYTRSYQDAVRLATYLGKIRFSRTNQNPQRYAGRVSKIVSGSAKFVPYTTCLPQALVAKILLDQAHIANQLQAGFIYNENNELKGHAWLLHGNQVVIGGDVNNFVPMSIFENVP